MENKYELNDFVFGIDSTYSLESGTIVKVMYGNSVGLYKSDEKFLYRIKTECGKTILFWEDEIFSDPEKTKEKTFFRESMMYIDPYMEENW